MVIGLFPFLSNRIRLVVTMFETHHSMTSNSLCSRHLTGQEKFIVQDAVIFRDLLARFMFQRAFGASLSPLLICQASASV